MDFNWYNHWARDYENPPEDDEDDEEYAGLFAEGE